MRILTWIAIILFITSCSKNSETGLKQLFSSKNSRILGHLNNELLTDTLLYFKNDTLILKQYWENGILLRTDYNDNNQFRKLVFINKWIDSLRFEQYYSDINDSTFKIMPYDSNLVEFYNTVKVLKTDSFQVNQETRVRIYNVPTEMCGISVAGGSIMKKESSEDFFVTPTKKEGDSLKIYIMIRGLGFPKEFALFEIKK